MNDNEKIKFWINLWDSIIENFLKKSFGLNLYSPHILIEDIITEIEENSFQNSDNRKYFYDKLDYYFKNDEVIIKRFHSSFKLIRSVFNSERHKLILELSRNIKHEFEAGAFFNENLLLLSHLLFSNSEIDKNFITKITYISECIIIEFIKKGYILKEIKRFTADLFDDYQIIRNNNKDHIISNYPHNISTTEYDNDEYCYMVKNFLDELISENRIKALSSFFYKEKEELYYIFIVKGLKGNVDLNIGEVTFYSTDKKKFLSEPENIEDMQNLCLPSKEKFIQAVVKVNALSPVSSRNDAINILESTIDLVRCYFNIKATVEIETSEYIVCKNGKSIHSSWGTNLDSEFWQFQESLNLNRFENQLTRLNDYKFLFLDKDKKSAISKLNYAVHWFSKAENSTKQEDKMLNYWIAIENLFNSEDNILDDILTKKQNKKIDLIKEVISSIEIKNFFYEYGWEMFNHYRMITRNKVINRSSINLPEEILEKANLNVKTGERIYLKKFIDSIDDIVKYETNPFFIEKLKDVLYFYNDNSYAIKKIEEQIEYIKNDILMIYRFRNLIVHNAHFDSSLLPYYVWKIKSYSSLLIMSLLDGYKTNKKELSELMLNIFIKKELFLNDLKSGNKDFW